MGKILAFQKMNGNMNTPESETHIWAGNKRNEWKQKMPNESFINNQHLYAACLKNSWVAYCKKDIKYIIISYDIRDLKLHLIYKLIYNYIIQKGFRKSFDCCSKRFVVCVEKIKEICSHAGREEKK